MRLHTKILLGLLVGAVLGVSANLTLGGDHPVVQYTNHYVAGPIGQIFLRLLFMIVMPLVFASISLGVASIGSLRSVGRVGGKTLLYFLVTTVLSTTMGIILVSMTRPGSRITSEVRTELLETYAGALSSKIEAVATSEFGVNTLVNIVTRNPLKSAVEFDMLGVIFFGLMFGAAITLITEERGRRMVGWLEALNEIVVKIVEMAMKLAPYGVTGLIFGVTSRFGWTLLQPLGIYVAVVLGALLLHVAVTMSLIVRFVLGMSPAKFFSRIRAALVTAFSTSSSQATLPTNLAVSERNLGVPPKIGGFVLPLGATMCMNGTSLFEGITVIFLAQVFGLEFTIPQMAIVMSMAVITAVGAAAVPGASIPLLVGILAMFGVPGEGIALILGVDRILDMSRTAVNIVGDLTCACFIGKTEGLWDASRVPDEAADGDTLDQSPGWPTAEDAPSS